MSRKAPELDKINAKAKENEAQRAAAHALELDKIKATAKENEAQRALELVKIKATAKREFWSNATSVLTVCLALAVVMFTSREVAGWVKTTFVPLLNSTSERLIGLVGGLMGGVVGFVNGLFCKFK